MKIFLLLATALLTTSQVQATCKLPVKEKITIGCTYKCDFFTRSRLKAAAARLGYRVKIITLNPTRNIAESLAMVDSILIPGGADIDPKYYLKNVTDELREYTENNLNLVKFTAEGKKRDFFEYSLVKLYLASPYKKLPMLGICRGMQMMSVAKGLPLYLDIKTELGIPNRLYKFDRINIADPESLMSSIYGDKKFSGFEMHHQGIRVDYYEAHRNDFHKVNVSSFSNDGKIAESIEYLDKTALGVQYHPEKSLPGATFPVYKWLLTKACEFKTSSKDLLQ
jgi:putative glutamine amidotransferase